MGSATSWATAGSPSGWYSTLPRRNIAAALAALALLLAFTLFRPPSTPGPLERDFEAYYAAGATLDSGGDPYSRSIWRAESRIPGVDAGRDELLPFVGPAAALPLWATLARFPYRIALAAWTAILIGAGLSVVLCALRLARAPRDPLVWAAALGLALAAAPMIGALALGQAALVSAAAVGLAIVAYRTRLTGGAYGATLIAGIQPNLAFALLARLRTRRDLAIAGAAALTFAAATFAFGGGPAGWAAYLHRLGAHGSAERFVTIQYTPAAIAYAFGAAPALAMGIGTGVALAAIAATIGLVLVEQLDPTTATLLACATLPLAVPFFHEHDFVLEVLPLLVLALSAQGPPRAWASVAAALILVDWFGLAQRHLAQGQIVALGFAVAWAFVALTPRGSRRGAGDAAGVAVLTLLAAVALPLGHARPAPTWPDTLPASYHADSALDASAVWGDEQRVAGLTFADPVWGLLRTLPLAGCIVLAGALTADLRQRRQISTPNISSNGVVLLGCQPRKSRLYV